MTPFLLKVDEAAKLLAMSRSELYNASAPRGPIPVIQHGKRGKRYAVKDLERYIESRRVVQK